MIEQILQILALWIYLPKLQRIERKIGYKLTFNYIPARYIPAVMSCEMTKTWQNFGLNAEKGLNHFTMGGWQMVGPLALTRIAQNTNPGLEAIH